MCTEAIRLARVLVDLMPDEPEAVGLLALMLHCAAPHYRDTDWPTIVRFYDRLLAVMPTPVIALNRAVAQAELQGPVTGLAMLDEIAGQLAEYHLLHASRGSMLERVGRRKDVADA